MNLESANSRIRCMLDANELMDSILLRNAMSKPRLFYGWWVLLGIFISYAALVGFQVYTLPLFYPELKSEFGWSEESITLAATIFYLTGAILTPIVSPLFDRYSARVFMIAGGFITILGLFAYRSMQTLLQLTLIYIVLALSQVCAGQVPTILIVTRWFRRYRGIAIGITLIGTSVGGALCAPRPGERAAVGRPRPGDGSREVLPRPRPRREGRDLGSGHVALAVSARTRGRSPSPWHHPGTMAASVAHGPGRSRFQGSPGRSGSSTSRT